MRTLTQNEVERLVKKVSMRRAKAVGRLIEKVVTLEVGQEYYQHHLSELPKTPELSDIVNSISPDMDFRVYTTINGYIFIRTR